MARSDVVTLLSLDRFFKIVGYHPLHANQVVVADLAPASTCANPLVQHGWQEADRLGREEVSQAIASAEEMLAEALGFYVAPKWTKYDAVQYVQPSNPTFYGVTGYDIRGLFAAVRTSKGYVINGGVRATSLISNRPIVYTDSDGDGYFETATVTVTTAITDVEEIAVFYPSKSGDMSWQVRPIKVTITGGTATIVMRREQLVLELLQEEFQPEAVNGLDNANFLTTVDVYRVYNDPQTQVNFITDRLGTCGVCGDGSCASCTFAQQAGCIRTIDSRNGLVSLSPGTWSVSDEAFTGVAWSLNRAPSRVELSYRSGWRNRDLNTPLIDMDPMWERAVAYLALALSDRDFCECKSIEMQAKHWREDLALNSESGSFQISGDLVLNNPLGTTRAAKYAWRLVRQYRLGEAVMNA